MRSIIFLTMICATFLTLAGCAREPVVVASDKALFCDVEVPRRFTQEELDWRAENAPWNLRKDYSTNLTWERECEEADK